ncbi:MAG TPA: hypothetical protein PK854_01350 [Oscillospiraceae bacterium]|nr:hypothetical protein [Oscillospiraceae bacterium]HPS33897.1 hypothetical protein [Oscillospiraceae bacterium]
MAKRTTVIISLTAVILVLIMVTTGCAFKTNREKEPVTSAEMTVAGLRLGMSMEAVRELMGDPITNSSKSEYGDNPRSYQVWEFGGLSVCFVTYWQSTPVVCRVTVTTEAYQLPSGLKIGSHRSRVLDVYAKDDHMGLPLSGFDAEMQLIDYHESELRKSVAYGLSSASFVYQDLTDKFESGGGTAYLFESESGSILNYHWTPSDNGTPCQLSFVFNSEGNAVEFIFSNTDDTPYYNQKPVKPDDLAFGEIKLGLTMDEVRAVLGEPTKIEDSDDLEENLFFYGHYYNWYYGDDFVLKFYDFNGIYTDEFQLGSVWSQSSAYQLPSGLTVGDPFIKVIDTNALDSNFGKDVIGYNDEPFGFYLYGGFTKEDFETIPTIEMAGTAYVNTYGGTVAGDGSCMVIYEWYPRGSFGTENSFSLIFDINSDKTVEQIRFSYDAMQFENTELVVEQPLDQYSDWDFWNKPEERWDLLDYNELLAKMPAITSNADASRFTAKDGTIGGIGAGATLEDIKKKFGEPLEISSSYSDGPLNQFYRYEGVWFSFFRGFTDEDKILFYPDENAKYVSSAVVYGKGIEGPRGIKIGDSFESVMAMYPQDDDYRTNVLFYGIDEFDMSGKVYISDLSRLKDPFAQYEGPGCPICMILVPDEEHPFIKLFFDDNLTLKEMRIYY